MICPSSMRPTYRSGDAGQIGMSAAWLLSTWVIDRERGETAKRFVQGDGHARFVTRMACQMPS